MDFVRYLANRFKEPSSYGGLAPLLAGAGLNVPPGALQAGIYAAAGVCGLLAFFLPEKSPPK